MRFVLTIFAFIALTQAIEFNNQRKSALEKAFQPTRHPIVLQESSGDDVSSNSTGEEEIVWIGNSTNSLGFEFKNLFLLRHVHRCLPIRYRTLDDQIHVRRRQTKRPQHDIVLGKCLRHVLYLY